MNLTEQQNTRDAADGSSSAPGAAKTETGNVPMRGRRSQRVRFEMPVGIYMCRENEESTFEEGKTLSVNAHGGLLALTTPVAIGEMLRLINPRTGNEIDCRVCRFGMQYPGGVRQVGVEFAAVSPAFWDVDSRPLDWDPSWVPPAERARPQISLPPDSLPDDPVQGTPRWRSPPPSARAKTSSQEISQAKEAAKSGSRGNFKWPIVALAGLATLFIVWTVVSKLSHASSPSSGSSDIGGMEPEDVRLIPGIERLRLATEEDFDQDAISWLHSVGQQVSGKITGAYSGGGKSSAYILVDHYNARRAVIIAYGQVIYNAEYPVIAAAALFPKELIQKISWADPSPPESDGDGLLIVRAADGPASGVVLFLRGTEIVSGNPIDYRQIPLGQAP